MKHKILSYCGSGCINIASAAIIAAWAVFMYLGNNPRVNDPVVEYQQLLNYPAWIPVAVSISIIAIVLFSIKTGAWSLEDCGFGVSRPFWVFSIAGLILVALMARDVPQVLTFTYFIRMLPILFVITASELVLRVLFFNLAERLFGTSESIAAYTSIVCGLLISYVLIPTGEITLSLVLYAMMLSYLYRISHSILIVLFADFALYSNIQYSLLVGIMVIVLYSAVVIWGTWSGGLHTNKIRIAEPG